MIFLEGMSPRVKPLLEKVAEMPYETVAITDEMTQSRAEPVSSILSHSM